MRYLLLFLRFFLSAPRHASLVQRAAIADYRSLMALNEASQPPELMLCINQQPWKEGEDWVMLSNWTEAPAKQGLQVINAQTVAPLVENFRQAKTKAGANWRGVPIYVGHPTRDEIKAGVKPIGRAMDMQARNDGLYVQRKLNTLGVENDKEGFFPFPSAGWYVEPIGNGRVRPDVLDHIGMVEHPNISAVPAWTNSQEENQNQDNPDDMNTKAIAALLGLPETAVQSDLEGAIKALQAKAGKADTADAACNAAVAERDAAKVLVTNEKTRADAEKQRADGLDTALNAEKTAKHKLMASMALNEGRISKAEEETWIGKLATNAAAEEEITKLPKKFNRQSLALNRGQKDETMLARNEANSKLQDMVNNELPKHRGDVVKAFRAVTTNPANRKLVLAANGETEEA